MLFPTEIHHLVNYNFFFTWKKGRGGRAMIEIYRPGMYSTYWGENKQWVFHFIIFRNSHGNLIWKETLEGKDEKKNKKENDVGNQSTVRRLATFGALPDICIHTCCSRVQRNYKLCLQPSLNMPKVNESFLFCCFLFELDQDRERRIAGSSSFALSHETRAVTFSSRILFIYIF